MRCLIPLSIYLGFLCKEGGSKLVEKSNTKYRSIGINSSNLGQGQFELSGVGGEKQCTKFVIVSLVENFKLVKYNSDSRLSLKTFR